MEKKLELWAEQGDIKIAIRDCIGKGINRTSHICERLYKESEARWPWLDIFDAIVELLKDRLLIAVGDGRVLISELSKTDELIKAGK